jgi:putative transposase
LRNAGVWEALNHHLVMLDRERTGREASPSAAMIDSQSVKSSEAGGPRGDGAIPLLRALRRRFPFVLRAFAVHAQRWVVEGCFARLGRNRRLAKEPEATIGSAEAFLYAASVMLLLCRVARAA